MAKNKIVKYLTKAFIFSLCCVFMLGAVCLPINATLIDYEYSSNGLTMCIESKSSLNSVIIQDLPFGCYLSIPSVMTVSGWIEADNYEFLRNVKRICYDYPINNGDTKRFKVTYPIGYIPYLVIDTYDMDFNLIRTTTEPIPSTDYEVPTINLQGPQNYYNPRYQDIRITLIQDDESIATTAYFNIHFDNSGSLTPPTDNDDRGIVQMMFDPIGAIFNVSFGEIEGVDVTIGGIFMTIVGILLFRAFLKYFAGG